MNKLTYKAFPVIVLGLLLVLAVTSTSHAARYFEYFEGLPAGYREPDWQGYNYHASDPIDGNTEVTLYGYPKTDAGQIYTCIGWKDATGSITPQTGDINRVTFTINTDSSITWIYKKAHEVTFTVSPMQQTLAAWGADTWGQLEPPPAPTDWLPYNGHEYALTPELTWEQAEAYAVSYGAHLVTVNEFDENNWLRVTFGDTDHFWIGLRDIAGDFTWQWAGGEPVTWTHWSTGNPDYMGVERYVVMNYGSDGEWNNDEGYLTFRGIMERPEGADVNWTVVAAGAEHTVALKADGSLWAWGDNRYGQLGLGDTNNREVPDQIQPGTKWAAVAAGQFHTLAIQADGTLWAWGYNAAGQLGMGDPIDKHFPTQVGSDDKWIAVYAGGNHSFGIKSDGTLWGWGDNGYGQLGLGHTDNKWTPRHVQPESTWLTVAAGHHHTLGIKSDGSLWAWGVNHFGQLGLGHTNSKWTPRRVVAGPPASWKAVAAGIESSLAIRSDGTLWAWGYNHSGQLGIDNTGWEIYNGHWYKLTPSMLASAAEPYAQTLGVHLVTVETQAEGTWLKNKFGHGTLIGAHDSIIEGRWQWWTGEIYQSSGWWNGFCGGEPNDAGSGEDYAYITDGVCWNDGSDLPVQGIMERTFRTPAQVGSDNDWISVAAGHYHTLAIKTDGTLYSWGLNASGQLGFGLSDGNAHPTPEQVEVGGDTDWVSVAAGRSHTIAIRGPNRLELEPHAGPKFLPAGTDVAASARVTPTDGQDAPYSLTSFTSETAESSFRVESADVNFIWNFEVGHTVTVNLTFPPDVQAGADLDRLKNASGAFPAEGDSRFTAGFNVSLHVDPVIEDPDGTVYVCTGWTDGTGNGLPASGDGSSATTGPLAQDSSITWNYAKARSLTTEFEGLPEHLQTDDFDPRGAGKGWNSAEPVWLKKGNQHTFTAPNAICDDNGRVRYILKKFTVTKNGTTSSHPGVSDPSTLPACGPNYSPGNASHVVQNFSQDTTIEWFYNKRLRLRVGVAGLAEPAVADADPYGDAYYEPDSLVTVSAPKDAGNNRSFDDLLVLAGTTGSPSAPVADTTGGRKETTFLFTEPTELSWSYEQAERWFIGQAIDPPPDADDSRAPDWPVEMPDAFFWDDVNQTLYPVQPFASAVLEWTNQTQGGDIIDQTGYAVWPSDKTLWSWGSNSSGQLGLGSTNTEFGVPEQVAPDDTWIAIAAGASHTVAIKPDGSMWAWGDNQYGQLGLNNNTNTDSPQQVIADLDNDGNPDTDWAAVAAGGNHTLAIKDDGSLWTWGLNNYGQLGLADTDNRSYPTRSGAATGWVAVAGGYYHSLAVKSSGTLWSWGNNAYGQLGRTGTAEEPAQVGLDDDWASVAAGIWHSLATKSNGTLRSWGRNDLGQLGRAGATDEPVQVGLDGDWASVAAGLYHTLATKTDGSLYGWGWKLDGGVYHKGTSTNTPERIMREQKWKAVAAGASHAIALESNGTVWVWGSNASGQLGLGPDALQYADTPARVGTNIYWGLVAAGDAHSLALKSNFQKHVAGTPANLQPPDSTYTYAKMHYSEPYGNLPGPTPGNPVFDPSGSGKSLLRFYTGENDPPLFVIAETVDWEAMLWTTGQGSGHTAIIGEDINPPGDVTHDDPEEKNGYLFFEKAYYDGFGDDKAYDRSTRAVQIIPVNATTADTPTDRQMVVVWYETGAAGAGWPVRPVRYQCGWPQNPERIIIASGNGSEPLAEYEYLGKIYFQPDPDQAGYNPNEEHALLLGNKVFALKNDLNTLNGETSSEPYVLLKYWYPDTGSWKMNVFKVAAMDIQHTFTYAITAGKPIIPLMPMDALPKPPGSEIKKDQQGNGVGEAWYHLNHKGGHWAKASAAKLDVVVGNSGPNRIQLNDGDGTFDPGSDIGSNQHNTISVALGDVDGDGHLDVVAGNLGQPNRLYLNNGDGIFDAGSDIDDSEIPNANTHSVALGDVDGDGHLDLVSGNQNQPNRVYLNNGDGTFDAGSDIGSGTHNTNSVTLGDADGDGDLDVVAGNFGQPNRLYLNNGDATFAAGTDISPDTHNTISLALGDVNGDGHLDVVAGDYAQPIRLYLNNGDATFAAGNDIGPDAHWTYSVALGDVDGDGHLDVVAGNYYNQSNSIYLNNGDGTFAAGSDIGPDAHSTYSVALGEVDGDGHLDLVAGNDDGQPNRLYLNNGDGTFAAGSDIESDAQSTHSVALGYVGNDSIVTMHWYYPLQSGFYYPFRQADGSPVGLGDPVPFLNGGGSHQDAPRDVAYLINWPEDVKTLNIGETLTEAKYGLPDIVNWAAGQVIFDENVHNGGGSLARLIDPFTERSVPLNTLPEGLKTENVEGKLRFPDLPYALRSRLFFDPTNEKLIFKGISYDPGMGEPLLLPNIMTVGEKERLIDFEPDWRNAVEDLFDETRNYVAGSQQLVGVPMALSAGAADGEGHVVLAENDDESLEAAPVALHVIKVAGGPYRGEIKVITPDNVFDEKLTLRHAGDFGGEPEKLTFAWYYKPDNSGLPPVLPESTTDTNGWVLFDQGQGMNDITIEGAGKLTLSDNWFMVHYYYGTLLQDGDYPDAGYPALAVDPDPAASAGPFEDRNNWSAWAGAPGGETAQLAPGWIKRVVADLNPLDARVKDFRNYAVSTDVSMVTQLGQRYEGDIALSGVPGNLNNLGLIEAYETVMGRARDFSIDAAPQVDYGPVNNAILNAGTRIADFYTLLDNEAYWDAQDPTIGFDTSSGALGSMASSIFAFQNQLSSLLEEELALLRGRDDTLSTTRARPVYNRLVWNFTQGDGELAYAQAYNIRDMDESGVVDELDAKDMYPQGHGDAWGHYLTAMKIWYKLLRHDHFTWEPRVESVLVDGAPIPVDYLDERKFARTAAAKARAGAEIVNLTYRRSYVEEPAGQWQGYKDTDAQRAWGVDGWARRAGQGAFFDWAVANAMLPSQDPVAAHSGIQKIDRGTVPELAGIAAEFQAIQIHADRADRGLNPLGLAKGVVSFDLDPNLLTPFSGTEVKTHFEQVHDRAVGALENARTVFDYATQSTLMLRQNEDALVGFRRGVEDQEKNYTNRLIEIFGYPYEGDIGPGGTYKSGYSGPDLFHYLYVDLPDLTGEPLMGQQVAYTYTFKFDGPDFQDDEEADPLVKGLNVTTTTDAEGNITPGVEITYHVDSEAPWLSRPTGWGQRRAPGEIQMALSELIKAHASYKQGLTELEGQLGVIQAAVDILEAKHGVLAHQIDVIAGHKGRISNIEEDIRTHNQARLALVRIGETLGTLAENLRQDPPGKAVSNPWFLFLWGEAVANDTMSIVYDFISELFLTGSDIIEEQILLFEHRINEHERDQEYELFIDDARFEVQQMVKELETMESDVRAKLQELYGLKEVIHQCFGRFQATLAEGERLLTEREVFRKRAAADVQDYRYQDMGFRTFRNDAVAKYRATFDLASRYAYLAATAYDYETNLLGSETGSGRAFLTDIVKQRAPGEIIEGQPVVGKRGLADPLARMDQNFEVHEGRLGFNNPQAETNRFALRQELFRFRDEPASDWIWQAELDSYRVDDLWDFPPFRRFCRPFADESIGPQPGLVIPFSTEVNFGYNFFGWPLGGGDSAYDPSNFATKIRSVGVWFSEYDADVLSSTPRVYLVPVGADVLRTPDGDDFTTREWHVVDQKLPVPFPVSDAELSEETWIPVSESLSDILGGIRRFSSFRAFADSNLSELSEAEIIASQSTTDTRLIGRSVWNTQWLLIIPGGTLLADPDAGLDAFVDNVTDIKLFFQTYAYSGN